MSYFNSGFHVQISFRFACHCCIERNGASETPLQEFVRLQARLRLGSRAEDGDDRFDFPSGRGRFVLPHVTRRARI